MKFAGLKYNFSGNLGDQIQSLAAEQHLPKIDKKFDRDNLRNVNEKEKYLLIMNGWFSHFPERCFPPSDSIIPVFFGFHISDWYGEKGKNHFLKPDSISYFKKYEPIGCRDQKTAEMLQAKGINAFYSKCLTLTFPKRKNSPKNGKVLIVDAENIPLPKFLTKNALKITQSVPDYYDDDLKTKMAKKLLNLYRDEARLVITTRLHCALPCVAMGIPILFFGNQKDYRISILKDLKIPIHKSPAKRKGFLKINPIYDFYKKIFAFLHYRKINWNPKPVDFEAEKQEMIAKIKKMIADRLAQTN